MKNKAKNIIIILIIVLGIFILIINKNNNYNLTIIKEVHKDNRSENIVAVKLSEDGTNFTPSDEIPSEGYTFNDDKSYCEVNKEPDDSVTFNYHDGVMAFDNMTSKATKCYLWFDKVREQTSETIIAAIRNSNIYKGDSAKPDFTKVAEGDGTKAGDNSGIYRTADPMYGEGKYSYYWRGAVTNNYVTFAGKCWRIVRINGDGSIRLIYDGTTCHANGTITDNSVVAKTLIYSKGSVYDNSAYVGYTFVKNSQRTKLLTEAATSTLKKQIDDWFNNNANFAAAQREQVAEGKFCNDRRTKNDETWRATGDTQYYAAYARIVEGNQEPSLSCYDNPEKSESDIYTLKAGTITADEVQFAGASGRISNKSYYLYNGQHYWTMSPSRWYYRTSSDLGAEVLYVSNNGSFYWYNVKNVLGVRPVINLKADTVFSGRGNGTQEKPYTVP